MVNDDELMVRGLLINTCQSSSAGGIRIGRGLEAYLIRHSPETISANQGAFD